MVEVDLFVIGAGSGGVACARRAAGHGARVAMAEVSRVGGTCVIRGCVPKKLMSYGAHFADLFRAAGAYGWDFERPQLDFRRLLQNRNREIARLNGIYISMLEKSGVRLIEGRATIVGHEAAGFQVQVAEQEFLAANVLLATGAAPVLPDLAGVELGVTSDLLMEEVYDLPRRLAVIGAGYIGLEQASIFHGLGAEVHLILRRDQPLAGFDDELRAELAGQLEASGIHIHRRVAPRALRATAEGILLDLPAGPLTVDKVLLATGRRPRPNTAGLGLEALGVQLDLNGAIKVDQAYRATRPGLFAVGDCSDHAFGCHPEVPAKELGLASGQFDLTPVAIAEGRAVAERLFHANPTTIDYRVMPTAIFSIPQAASVGLSERRARELGHALDIYRTRFRPMFHTLPDGAARTLMKLVVDKTTDRVLGCHMVGDDAAEIVQCLAVAMTVGASKAEFDATMALHPTSAEEFVTLYRPAG